MFQIISDSGCDFTREEVQAYNIDVVPFYITFDEGVSLREGVDISHADYFQRLLDDKRLFPKTSQPNPQDYLDIYTPHLMAGKDILVLTISSKLSGSYASAKIAAEVAKEEYPERTITVVDSLSGSVGQGLILREIINMRDAGFTLDKAAEVAEKVIKTTQVYFTLDNLEYLKKGGRVGPTTALVGGILGLRPILYLVDGNVSQLDNVRGKKKALKLIEEAMVEALKDEKQNIRLSIGHILSEDDAVTLKTNIDDALDISSPNPITSVGATIGTHAGPGALAFAYCKKYQAV